MKTVLIVDDVKENREALRDALGDVNPDWSILVAAEEKSAARTIKRQLKNGVPVDVVLTDLVMETEQAGMNLLREARKIDPLIMSILFTAKEKSLDRYAALELGAFDVVEKNIRGTQSYREISIKTRAALGFREWAQRIGFLRRYFDPRVFGTIEKDAAALEMKQRTVTICFWDIRGFSNLCEILKAYPNLVAGFLREYCDATARTIFDHTGVLDKFIGDGVMALFGVLNSDSDDKQTGASAAVKAAMAVRKQFEVVLSKWTEQWKLYEPRKIELGLGCGIHTGEALVGNVGTDFRDQFTALGPHVNFASRLCAKADAGQILISQTAKMRLDKGTKTRPAGEISNVKNIVGTFALFSV